MHQPRLTGRMAAAVCPRRDVAHERYGYPLALLHMHGLDRAASQKFGQGGRQAACSIVGRKYRTRSCHNQRCLDSFRSQKKQKYVGFAQNFDLFVSSYIFDIAREIKRVNNDSRQLNPAFPVNIVNLVTGKVGLLAVTARFAVVHLLTMSRLSFHY